MPARDFESTMRLFNKHWGYLWIKVIISIVFDIDKWLINAIVAYEDIDIVYRIQHCL